MTLENEIEIYDRAKISEDKGEIDSWKLVQKDACTKDKKSFEEKV